MQAMVILQLPLAAMEVATDTVRVSDLLLTFHPEKQITGESSNVIRLLLRRGHVHLCREAGHRRLSLRWGVGVKLFEFRR